MNLTGNFDTAEKEPPKANPNRGPEESITACAAPHSRGIPLLVTWSRRCILLYFNPAGSLGKRQTSIKNHLDFQHIT